jgi:hypothetical protein
MEATCSSETSVGFQQTAWCYTPEDRTVDNLSSKYSYGPKFIMKLESKKEREKTRK